MFIYYIIFYTSQILQSHIEDITNIWLFDDKDTVEYFKLEDLWRSFEEGRAYGVGTPIVLDHGKSIVQYYVPYLSAIQIYSTKTRTAVRYHTYKSTFFVFFI